MKKENGAIISILLPMMSILIIGMGIYVYNSSYDYDYDLYYDTSSIISAADQMGQQEKEIYNATVKKYIGNTKRGTEVKLMIEDIITSNNQNVGESGKFFSIHNGDVDGYNKIDFDDEGLEKACVAANIYENPTGDGNTQENINEASKEMRSLSQKISAGRTYKVETEENDGVIYAVYISTVDD